MPTRLVFAPLVIAAIAAGASGQTLPATAPASSTAPASPDEAAARDAIHSFFRAVLSGDDKAAFALLYCAKPENRAACETMFGEVMAQQRLQAAVAEQFGLETVASLDLERNEAAGIEKNLDKAKVTIKQDGAEVVVDRNIPPMVLIKKDGKWMIDFEQSQENMGPMPKPDEIDVIRKRAAVYDKILADVKAKKYKSADQLQSGFHDALESALKSNGDAGLPMPTTQTR